ncbi:tryptophan synthase subunit alpha [Haliea sp. E17]|uniref:tryptophan synthase subunit alpha n=1 Tax=Haliea sp. E17 TaxID=3401576 RepID=UPI003AAF4CB8
MSRIAGRFEQLAREGRKAVIPYVVAGDPVLEATVPLMHALVAQGADIIELGVPFSDPMSEGPVIQQAHERALANGTSLRDALACVRQFRERDNDTPVLLMGYANPVEHMGYARFADAAAEAGLDALLTVDIPPEEVEQVNRELHRVGLDNIFLVAPTTPDARIGRIADQASGFIYYVSLKGVTGAGHLDTADVAHHVARIRERSSLPVAVGFGIRDARSAAQVAGIADGVVVGSALIRAMADKLAAGADRESATAAACELLAQIRGGVDSVCAS